MFLFPDLHTSPAPSEQPAGLSARAAARAPSKNAAWGEPWKLNSGLTGPHGVASLTALAAHPTLHAAAATGASDGSIKARVWVRVRGFFRRLHQGEAVRRLHKRVEGERVESSQIVDCFIAVE
jgi:hypothetical protein